MPAIRPEIEPNFAAPPSPERRGWLRRIFGMRVLVFSIVVHVILGLVAAIWVVQSYSAARKLTFKAGPPSPNRSTRAVEHKVQMAKKQSTMSAPPIKRIVSTGVSRITLPAMPAMPALVAAPNKMAGASGAAASMANGPMGATNSAAGGSLVPSFGFTAKPTIGTLKGTLIDFKQLKNGQLTKITIPEFDKVVVGFAKDGFNLASLTKFFISPHSLYTTQFIIPQTASENGPAAFKLQGIVKPNMWIVHYVGKVIPPKSGAYYFVGEGDDFMYVKFQGKLVLDSCWSGIPRIMKPTAVYNYNSSAYRLPFKRGEAIHVEAGKSYDMEVVIGDQGGLTNACLLIEEEGVAYKKDEKGNPVLPPFRLAPSTVPPVPRGMTPLELSDNGPVWGAIAEKPASALDAFKNR